MDSWEEKKGLGLNYYTVERGGSLEKSSGIPKGPELWNEPVRGHGRCRSVLPKMEQQ